VRDTSATRSGDRPHLPPYRRGKCGRWGKGAGEACRSSGVRDVPMSSLPETNTPPDRAPMCVRTYPRIARRTADAPIGCRRGLLSVRPVDGFAADWTAICRRSVTAQRRIFDRVVTSEERTVYEGVGEGGDHTLVIDRECEDEVFAELDQLGAERASFVAVSEERGEVVFGDGGAARVVIDPIDGSLNARRTIPSHSLSIAVAADDSMADVRYGFVHDFGADDEFVATLGEGAEVNGSAARVADG